MNQIFNNLFSIIIIFGLIHVAYALGNYCVKKMVSKQIINHGFDIALAVILGYGIMAYFTLIISLFGPLNKVFISLILLLVVILGRLNIYEVYKIFGLAIIKIRNWGKLSKFLFASIIFCFMFYLSSALVPPYRTDALAYHLPEVAGIANGGAEYFQRKFSGPGLFYGNLPVLMEVLYSIPYVLNGPIAVHLLHYSILIFALIGIFFFICEKFDEKKGLYSVLVVFSLYELFVNATNAYIDAAMTSFEILGLLVLLEWLVKKENNKLLAVSGFLYGLAFSTKYNAVYGVLIASTLLLLNQITDRRGLKEIYKTLSFFIVPVSLVAGFWYIKNLVLLGNPVYPFYFGHYGYTDNVYKSILEAINSFVHARTLKNFLIFPFLFFLNSYYIVLFLAVISWPLIFFNKALKSRLILIYVSIYAFVYTVVWFFVATHQIKFFFVPAVLLLMLFGIQLDENIKKIIKFINYKYLIILVSVLTILVCYKIVTVKNNYFITVKKTDLCYNFGLCDKLKFYESKKLGSIYQVSNYINLNFKNTIFTDIWSSARFFLQNNNTFLPPGDYLLNNQDINSSTFAAYLRDKNIKYGMVDSNEKLSELTNQDPSGNLFDDPINVSFRNKTQLLESVVKKFGTKIYDEFGVQLYKFDF